MKLIRSKKYQNVYSYKTKKGTFYTVRFVYYDMNGTRREKQRRGFSTALDAHKAELELEVKYADGSVKEIAASSLTVAQWVEQYVELNQKNWRPTTKRAYNGCFNNYLIPALGNCKLQKLTRAIYEARFINPQLEKLAAASIRDNHRIVMSLINSAIDYDLLDKNRLSKVKLPKANTRTAFEEEDLKKFNKSLLNLNYNYQVFFKLLELTGMRRGEAMALTWADINFKTNEININKSRTELGTGPTKTASSIRVISIDQSLADLLKHYRLFQRQKCLQLATPFNDTNIIFTTNLNKPIGPQAVNYNFKKAIKCTDIEDGKYVVHSLRHTHATYLLSLGVSPADVAQRLGHSNAGVTLSIYAHALKSNDKSIAAKATKLAEL